MAPPISGPTMLARAANRREIYENLIYDSNNGDALWGMDDKTMNKTELRNAQTWTQPIEDFIFQKNEELRSMLRKAAEDMMAKCDATKDCDLD